MSDIVGKKKSSGALLKKPFMPVVVDEKEDVIESDDSHGNSLVVMATWMCDVTKKVTLLYICDNTVKIVSISFLDAGFYS